MLPSSLQGKFDQSRDPVPPLNGSSNVLRAHSDLCDGVPRFNPVPNSSLSPLIVAGHSGRGVTGLNDGKSI